MAGEVFVDLLEGGIVTLQIASGAWLLAAALGLLLAVLRDLGFKAARVSLSSLVVALRSVPQLVILYLIYFGLGAVGIEVNSILAAILALGVTDAAFTAEYYRAGFMTVPWTQREAGLSLGLSHLGVLRWVVIPQAAPFVVPPLLNAFVGLLKTATLAAAVGAPEILYRGQNEMNRTGQIVLVVAVIIGLYVLVTMPLTRAVAVLERRVRRYAHA
jgi:His/Glu/Gln/Arg/opine family amino acid ABC transporter permease subunit